MDTEKEAIISAINSLSHDFEPGIDKELFDKNIDKSNQARQSGNQWFVKKNHGEKEHEEIWKLYTKSIAFAPTGSDELASGFSNRSVFLLHLKKYKEALSDIERALKIKNSSALKVKLFCRQAECFVAMQDGKQSSSLEKARYWLIRVDNDFERSKLTKMVEKAEQIIKDNIPGDLQNYKKNDLKCKNDGVAIMNDEKLGKGLMATRDFEPGEPVYIEKFYIASVNKSKMHAYCSHCLAISWALIACDQCAYRMYCSEKCKSKAWEEYHDIECRMRHINFLEDHYSAYYAEISIRTLIMGIKEAGNFKKLKSLINEMDNCNANEFFNKNYPSNGFKSFYNLKSGEDVVKLKAFATMAFVVMHCFTRCTGILGKHCLNDNGHLKLNSDVLFMGCLLVRLMTKAMLNSFSVIVMSEYCEVTVKTMECLQSFCCARGMSISLMTSLINHNCDNNVNKIYTNDGKVVYYAIKPIKAKSQIFSSYYFDYAGMTKINRQSLLSIQFEFHCDCIACKQNWLTAGEIGKNDRPNLHKYPAKYNSLTLKIMNKNQPLMISYRDRQLSRKEIQSLAKDIAILDMQKTQKPNMATATFHLAFGIIMERRYFDVLRIPKVCSGKENQSS